MPSVVVNGSPIPSVTGLLPCGAADRCAIAPRSVGVTLLERALGRRRRAAAGTLERLHYELQLGRPPCARSAGPCRSSRAGRFPASHLFLGLVRERRVDDVQQRVVLPEAERRTPPPPPPARRSAASAAPRGDRRRSGGPRARCLPTAVAMLRRGSSRRCARARRRSRGSRVRLGLPAAGPPASAGRPRERLGSALA